MAHKELKCGLYMHYLSDLSSAIQSATNSGYNFIVANLVLPRSGDFTPHCDLQLSSTDWGSLVVGIISNYELERKPLQNSLLIEAEITYALHLGLPALLFDCPSNSNAINQLSRIINSKITFTGGYQNLPQFWVQIPVHSPHESANIWRNDVEDLILEDTWLRWNQLRSHIFYDKRVCVALELNGDLPDEHYLNRWTGEPIKALIIPTSLFLTNRKNYPVLSKPYQVFIRALINKMANDIHFIIKGHCRHTDMRHYIQYMEHLKTTQMPSDPVSSFAKGYEDFLQIPLQPLMDNLESCTYEVFEKDPIKYEEYKKFKRIPRGLFTCIISHTKAICGKVSGNAVYCKVYLTLKAITSALQDIQNQNEIIVMVVGAGRGPLVQASLWAAEKVEKYVSIYAVEKNPNAIITLKTLLEEKWGGLKGTKHGRVEVVACDMREWNAPQKADLVVSELLGSFGDNELSPECLDGVWSYVKDNAISIPVSYTSYLAPIQSQRLYCEASMLRERDKPSYAPFETGYVVHMRNCYHIDQPQQLFSFDHSQLTLKPNQRENSRFRSLTFHTEIDTVCHGFAGYFETTLYRDIKLSTVPAFHTPGMFSWFPIYFPIHSPIFIKSGQFLKVNFWRLINKRQIWYEWCFTEPISSTIHNPNGRTYSIGLM